MKKFVWGSDFHIGLYTDEMNRTNEIIKVMKQIVNHAVLIKADGVIFGGDIFNNNNPSEDLIKKFISVVNICEKHKIPLFVMPGNHDTIADKDRVSCLGFLEEMSFGYPGLKYIPKFTTFKLFKAEVGDCWWTFIPDIKKAHISSKYKNVQSYIDKKAKFVQKKMPKLAQHYVFSHLNVPNASAGSEEYLLRKSQIYLPKVWTELTNPKKGLPIIIQAHIHTRQTLNNINIIGSPIFVGFGEKENSKYFLELHIPEHMGEGSGDLIYHKTNCLRFLEFTFEIKNNKFNIKKLLAPAVKKIKKDSIVKINLTLLEGVNFPLDEFTKIIEKKAFHVKPIVPNLVRKRTVRNIKQSVRLDPKDAARLWIKTNKPKMKKTKLKLAYEIIDEALNENT